MSQRSPSRFGSEAFRLRSQLRRLKWNPIYPDRVVETFSEGAVFLGMGPIRNPSFVVISAYTEKRLGGGFDSGFIRFAHIRQQGKLARLP